MLSVFEIQTDRIPVAIIRSKKRKHTTSITVDRNGITVHSPPRFSDGTVHDLLQEKKRWIETQWQLHNTLKPLTFGHGDDVLYFGNRVGLHIAESLHEKQSVDVVENSINVIIPPYLPEKPKETIVKGMLYRHYRSELQRILQNQVDHFAVKIGKSYRGLTIKNVSSQWGSCSVDQDLSFSWKLALVPHAVIDYVVVHEVSHLIHKHHKPEFWKCVERFDPDFKKHRKWLRDNHHEIEQYSALSDKS